MVAISKSKKKIEDPWAGASAGYSRNRVILEGEKYFFEESFFSPKGEVTTKISAQASAIGVNAKVAEYLKTFIPPRTIPVLLPQGTRFYESDDESQNFLIEVPPTVFTFRYDVLIEEMLKGTWRKGEDKMPEKPTFAEADVCMPWQYFWIKFNAVPKNDYGVTHTLEDVFLYWATERVESMHSPVYPARLPNINYKNGKVCLGEVFPDSMMSTIARAEYIVNFFFESKFNTDMGAILQEPTIKHWAASTKANKYAWLDWPTRGLNMSELRGYIKPKSSAIRALPSDIRMMNLMIDFIHEVDYLEKVAAAPPPERTPEQIAEDEAIAEMQRAEERARERARVREDILGGAAVNIRFEPMPPLDDGPREWHFVGNAGNIVMNNNAIAQPAAGGGGVVLDGAVFNPDGFAGIVEDVFVDDPDALNEALDELEEEDDTPVEEPIE